MWSLSAEEVAALEKPRNALPGLEEGLRDPAKKRLREETERGLAATPGWRLYALRRCSEVNGDDERAHAIFKARSGAEAWRRAGAPKDPDPQPRCSSTPGAVKGRKPGRPWKREDVNAPARKRYRCARGYAPSRGLPASPRQDRAYCRPAGPETPYLTATRGSVSSRGSCGTSTPSR